LRIAEESGGNFTVGFAYQDDHGCIPIETVTWRSGIYTQIMDHAREISILAPDSPSLCGRSDIRMLKRR
jgi:hypothetical protein